MTTRNLGSILGMAVAALLFGARPASAALLDRSPSPAPCTTSCPSAPGNLVFPQWYRDSTGLALALCNDVVPSPNVPVVGDPALTSMCVLAPPIPDPLGFAGNSGAELFYNFLQVDVPTTLGGGGKGWNLRYNAQLEAGYAPFLHPTRGTELVFARLRFIMSAPDDTYLGQYVITHPFGVEVFNVTAVGPRALTFTLDIPLGPALDFDGALNGRIGPFIQWDPDGRYKLDVQVGVDALGAPIVHRYVGDPNILHTFTGSPFGTNFVEVVGPPGAWLDPGNSDPATYNKIRQPLGIVSGLKYPGVIAPPLKVEKAVYATPSGSGIHTVDVWATSDAGQTVVFTGAGLPSIKLHEPPAQPGTYYGHIEVPDTAATPSAVRVVNVTTAAEPSFAAGALTDLVEIALASFDPATHTVTVTASTSDTTGPALSVEARGLQPSAWTRAASATPGVYTFTATVDPSKLDPPPFVKVSSAAGGIASSAVTTLPGSPANQPGTVVAVSDGSAAAPLTWAANQSSILVNGVSAPVLAGGKTLVIPVLGNDTGGGTATRVVLLSKPAAGVVFAANVDGTANPTGGKYFAFTANTGATALDSFTYAVENGKGYSNEATVYVKPPLVAAAPTATYDEFGMLQSSTKSFNVLANDIPSAGTTLLPGSLQVLKADGTWLTAGTGSYTFPTTAGAAAGWTVNPATTGSVAFTARTAATGSPTFTYRVGSNLGPTSYGSNTVKIFVFPTAEVIRYTTASYVAKGNQWTIRGTSTWFNNTIPPALNGAAGTNNYWYVDCNLVVSSGVKLATPVYIGRALIDSTGVFTLAPPTGPVAVTTAGVQCTSSNGGSATVTVAVK